MERDNTKEFTKFEIAQDDEADNGVDELVDTEGTEEAGYNFEAERETWGGEFEFVLSLVGFAVGLGNIWRFPYFCYRNGGGCAIIPFLLFLFVCGGPLYYMEVCLGQWSGSSPIAVWKLCPLFKGTGLVMVVMSVIFIWYYGIAFAWVLYFLIQSFYPSLPWSNCDNSWNTELCIDDKTNLTEKMQLLTNSSMNDSAVVFRTSGTEFWERNVLQKSEGIDIFGSVQFHLAGCLLLGWIFVFLCLANGIKTLGKVVNVTVTLPYILLTVLLIRGVTLDGAWNGLKHYFIPDFSRLAHGQVWMEAAVQCFYSLGPAWGGLITMASFNKFNHNLLRDTVIVCFADAFTGIYGGIVVFSVLGFLSKKTGAPLDKLPFSGAGLAFITYPEAISRLPAPNVWSVLFFLTLVLMAIDTQFACFETVTNTIVDLNYRMLQKYRLLISAVFVAFLYLLSLPFTTPAGYYIFILIDWYMSTFNLVGIAILECIAVFWIYGANRFSSDIEMMRGSRPSLLIRIIWCFVTPAFLLGILITTIKIYTTPSIGDYEFPIFSIVIGNIFAFFPISLAFAVVIYELVKHRHSLRKNLQRLLRPSSTWLPNDIKARQAYRQSPYIYESGLCARVLVNILGVKQKD